MIHAWLSNALTQAGVTHFLIEAIGQMKLIISFIILVPFTIISKIGSLYFISLEVDNSPQFIQYSADVL
ncbi:hypothetical protein O0Q50_02820 [Priestia aryabhattai]|uniref:Uncharacterized protein n=1 Tax=Priestia aryabhattai TaxID=412384 RepID=A0AAX6N2S3_PRIAR|nr:MULTISPECIES: hypothetical protein [Priestia]MDU9690089.1 hypothetical protein [Priestia aryabhattai]